jgi:predicted transglutaminase-like cysteine proteinase
LGFILGLSVKRTGVLSHLSIPLSVDKLGDLLVKSGKISPDQLIIALKIQQQVKGRIGDVLVDLGFISPAALWKTLMKQMSCRVLTTALGLVIGLSSLGGIKTARAESGSSFSSQTKGVQTASVMRAPDFSRQILKNENLFGSSERRSGNTAAFTKWHVALERSVSFAPDSTWQNKVQQFQGLSLVEKIKAVNTFANNMPYIEDIDLYGKSDYWATPSEFFARGGDCEDFAMAKYVALKQLGVSPSQMRLAIVKDKVKNQMHAILIVYTESGAYVLDNQNSRAVLASQINRYQPIYSINEQAWWRHS